MFKANATNTFKVLHISDIHYDPRYTPGKTSQCGEPLCCQDDQADGTDPSNTCGYWAEYVSGDTPLQTVEATFKQIATHVCFPQYFQQHLKNYSLFDESTIGYTERIFLPGF